MKTAAVYSKLLTRRIRIMRSLHGLATSLWVVSVAVSAMHSIALLPNAAGTGIAFGMSGRTSVLMNRWRHQQQDLQGTCNFALLRLGGEDKDRLVPGPDILVHC